MGVKLSEEMRAMSNSQQLSQGSKSELGLGEGMRYKSGQLIADKLYYRL